MAATVFQHVNFVFAVTDKVSAPLEKVKKSNKEAGDAADKHKKKAKSLTEQFFSFAKTLRTTRLAFKEYWTWGKLIVGIPWKIVTAPFRIVKNIIPALRAGFKILVTQPLVAAKAIGKFGLSLAKSGLNVAAKTITGVGKAIAGLGSTFGSLLTLPFSGLLGPLGLIMPILAPVGRFFGRILSPAIERFGDLMEAAFAPLQTVFNMLSLELVDLLRDYINPIQSGLILLTTYAFNFVKTLLKGKSAGVGFLGPLLNLADPLKRFFSAAMDFGSRVIPAIASAFQTLLPPITKVVGFAVDFAGIVLKQWGKIVETLLPKIATTFDTLVKAVEPFIPDILELGEALADNVFGPLIISSINGVLDVLKLVGKWFTDNKKEIKSWINFITDSIKDFFGNFSAYMKQFYDLFVAPLLEAKNLISAIKGEKVEDSQKHTEFLRRDAEAKGQRTKEAYVFDNALPLEENIRRAKAAGMGLNATASTNKPAPVVSTASTGVSPVTTNTVAQIQAMSPGAAAIQSASTAPLTKAGQAQADSSDELKKLNMAMSKLVNNSNKQLDEAVKANKKTDETILDADSTVGISGFVGDD